MKRFPIKRFLLSSLALIFLAFPTAVRADVAPPINPPGSNPQPGAETTQVRMTAETVLIAVLKDTKAGSLGAARVTADFTMTNTGDADEKMAVRFPISGQNGRGQYPEIENVMIKVGGRQVPFRSVQYPETGYFKDLVPWAEFDVLFPAGKDTPIQVSYTLRGTGYYPFTAFYYILETGAAWKGTIGSADVILRLPYPASPQNVIEGLEIGWATTTPGAIFDGNEARWHFENFEPGSEAAVRDMMFALVAPAAWNAVLVEQDNIKRSPKDGEAWGRLGRAYKQVFLMSKGYREDPGGEELYRSAVEAYEKCLELKPDDAQWHAGFADLLISRSYWDAWASGPDATTYRGLREIDTALRLAPKDAKVQEIAENIALTFPDGMQRSDSGYAFPWLTQTPTAMPTTLPPVVTPSPAAAETIPTPTATGMPATAIAEFIPTPTASAMPATDASATDASATGTPAATSAPDPGKSRQPGLSICGTTVMIPAAGLVLLAGKKARSRKLL